MKKLAVIIISLLWLGLLLYLFFNFFYWFVIIFPFFVIYIIGILIFVIGKAIKKRRSSSKSVFKLNIIRILLILLGLALFVFVFFIVSPLTPLAAYGRIFLNRNSELSQEIILELRNKTKCPVHSWSSDSGRFYEAPCGPPHFTQDGINLTGVPTGGGIDAGTTYFNSNGNRIVTCGGMAGDRSGLCKIIRKLKKSGYDYIDNNYFSETY